MRVDAIALNLRPRSMFEATDLGVRLVQVHARSIWRSFAPVYLLCLALVACSVLWATWLPVLLIFWLKPWFDRSLLFVLSRAVFGEETRFADLWRARSTVWTGQWLSTLFVRRFSFWRAYTQPADQLEGQPRAAARLRRLQLLRGRRGAAMAAWGAFANIETVMLLGLYALGAWFVPSGDLHHTMNWLSSIDGTPLALLQTLLYGAVVFVIEPFYVASGFAMYLNRRVELEAWDVEQEFRRVFA